MKKVLALLSVSVLLNVETLVHAESTLNNYDEALVKNQSSVEESPLMNRLECNPDVRLSVKIFVHDSVIGGKTWDAASEKMVKDRMARELPKVNQAYCDPTIGRLKTQFTFSFSFLSNNEFPVAGMGIGPVLNSFSEFWKSGKWNNTFDLGLVYVVNPDSGVGGVSWKGDVGGGNYQGGPALNWGWENKGEVIAHEVGHFFGAPHDGDDESADCPAAGNIMGGGRTLTWSKCSQSTIQNWMESPQSFYYVKSRGWLQTLNKQGPLGGSGGQPFIIGCPEGSFVEKAQYVTADVGNLRSVVDFGIACTNGYSSIKGSENIVTVDPDFNMKVYAGSWITALSSGNSHFGGAANGIRGNLQCPAGSRLAGFFGRKGAAIDNVGLFCTHELSTLDVGPAGGPGTNEKFDLSCEKGASVEDLLVTIEDLVGHPSVTNIGVECTNHAVKSLNQKASTDRIPVAGLSESLEIYHGSWINGISAQGNLSGLKDGLSRKDLKCPAGKNIVGIFGSRGDAVDTLGLHCR